MGKPSMESFDVLYRWPDKVRTVGEEYWRHTDGTPDDTLAYALEQVGPLPAPAVPAVEWHLARDELELPLRRPGADADDPPFCAAPRDTGAATPCNSVSTMGAGAWRHGIAHLSPVSAYPPAFSPRPGPTGRVSL